MRTTAFPCAIAARLIASGELNQPGVNPPELFAQDRGIVDYILAEHAERGVEYVHTVAAADA